MKYHLIWAVIIAFSATSSSGQELTGTQKPTAVLVPQEIYLQTVVVQSGCPLKLEKVQLLRYLAGGFGATYEVRNVGKKPIRSYTVAIWNSDNTGSTVTWHVTEEEGLLMPHRKRPLRSKNQDISIVPLTEELRTRLQLRPPMRKLVFFLVVDVNFSDGTAYESRSLFEELRQHLDAFNDASSTRVSR